MPVLDLVCRDARITHVTLVEPDIYKPHNVERHVFSLDEIGENKGDLARNWLKRRRPDINVSVLECDLLDPSRQDEIEEVAARADVGICAADNEIAKYHWDALMRRQGKPWTLGEVLSGGIGGFVHWFVPGGPCYGCVASHLHRAMPVEKPAKPDYSNPGAAVAETTIPASKASIHLIASLHALITLELLANPAHYNPGFTSLLFTLQRVPEVFDEAFRPYRFRIPRETDCLICQPRPAPSSGEELDAALDQALARLGDE
jgi:molybdopterin/thiamine biosynthesis adenylyltransferase